METNVPLTKAGLELRVENARSAKALVVLLNRPAAPDELQVDAPKADSILFAGNAIVVPLEAGAPMSVRLHAENGSDLDAVEAWVTR